MEGEQQTENKISLNKKTIDDIDFALAEPDQRFIPRITKLSQQTFSIHVSSVIGFYLFEILSSKYQLRLVGKERLPGPINFVTSLASYYTVGYANFIIIFQLISRKLQRRRTVDLNRPVLFGMLRGIQPHLSLLAVTQNDLLEIQLHLQSNESEQIGRFCKLELSTKSRCLNVLSNRERLYLLVATPLSERVTMQMYSDQKETYQVSTLQIYVIDMLSRQANKHFINKVVGDHLFEKSKSFLLYDQVILLSMFDEIIAVKQHFGKLIVVDAVCTRDNIAAEHLGQMVIVNQHRIIFTDHQKIYFYNLEFKDEHLKVTLADTSNTGNTGQTKRLLYQGVFLHHNNYNVQVLFYLNKEVIMFPRTPYQSKRFINDSPANEPKKIDVLKFNVLGIAQVRPLDRLRSLLSQNQSIRDLEQFTQRFKISELDYYKSKWEASPQDFSDIMNHLLNLKDFQFVKLQLDMKLKAKDHTFKELIKIEGKQLSILINNLISHKDIKNVKRVLKSIMFISKLHYKNQFEGFKSVGYIEIKKLRLVSLKEQIKLLCCKGFQSRLIHFLNIFKYMVIANFKEIFQFLFGALNNSQMLDFLVRCKFLLPGRHSSQQDCLLWQDFKTNVSRNNSPHPPLTVDGLLQKIKNNSSQQLDDRSKLEIRKKVEQLIKDQWFNRLQFKKHCLLDISEEQLNQQFLKLRNYQVYKILFEHIYKKFEESPSEEKNHDQVIESVRKILQDSSTHFTNLKFKEMTFTKIQNIATKMKMYKFVVLQWEQYFHFLVNELGDKIFNEVIDIYKAEGQFPLFLEALLTYCKSDICNSEQINKLINLFRIKGKSFQKQFQQILHILLQSFFMKVRLKDLAPQQQLFQNLSMNLQMDSANATRCWRFIRSYKFRHFFLMFTPELSYLEAQSYSKLFIQTSLDSFVNLSKASPALIIDFEDDKRVDCSDPQTFLGVLLKINVDLKDRHHVNQVYDCFLLRLMKQGLFELLSKITKHEVIDILGQNRDKVEQHAMKMISQRYHHALSQPNSDYIRSCINLIRNESLKLKELAFLTILEVLRQSGLNMLGTKLKEQLQRPTISFMMHMNQLTRLNKDQQLLIYNKYKEIKSGRPRIHDVDREFIEYRIEKGYDLLNEQSPNIILEQIERMPNSKDTIVEELQFMTLCKIIDDSSRKFVLDERVQEYIINKAILSFQDRSKYVRLMTEFNQNPGIFSHYSDKKKQASIKLFTESYFNGDIFDSRYSKSQIKHELSTIILKDIKGPCYYNALLKMLFYFPSIVTFYIVAKNQIYDYKILADILDRLNRRKFLRTQKYFQNMTVSLYVRALLVYNPEFRCTWFFFSNRFSSLYSDQFRVNVNLLVSRLQGLDSSSGLAEFLMQFYKQLMITKGKSGFIQIDDFGKKQNNIVMQAKLYQYPQEVNPRVYPLNVQQSRKQPDFQMRPVQPDLKIFSSFNQKLQRESQDFQFKLEQALQKNNKRLLQQRKLIDDLSPVSKKDTRLKEFKKKSKVTFMSEDNGQVKSNIKEQGEDGNQLRKRMQTLRNKIQQMRNKAPEPLDQSSLGRRPVAQVRQTSIYKQKQSYQQQTIKDKGDSVLRNSIYKILEEQNQLQLMEYVKKFAFISESDTIFKEVLKIVYRQGKSLKPFMRIVRAAEGSQVVKVVQKKAISVLQNAIKMQGNNMDLRKIFGVQIFFLQFPGNYKLYYSMLEQKISKNLLRILNLQNVYRISKIFNFCFGSQRDYQYNVYTSFIEHQLRKHLIYDYDPLRPHLYKDLQQLIRLFRSRLQDDKLFRAKMQTVFNKVDKQGHSRVVEQMRKIL